MESMFELREIVGVQDAVLLTDFTSEAVFLDNLSKRYLENIIYVSTDIVRMSGRGRGGKGKGMSKSRRKN